MRTVTRFVADERGATAIEYGLICALIFLVIVTSIYAFGDAMEVMYQYIGTELGKAMG